MIRLRHSFWFLTLLACWACGDAATSAHALGQGEGSRCSKQGGLTSKELKVIAALPSVPPELNHQYALEIKPKGTYRGSYSYAVKPPRLQAKEWVLLLPKAPTLPGQIVTSVKSVPKSEVTYDLSPLKQPILRARVKDDRYVRGITFRVDMEAKLFARKIVRRSEGKRYQTPEKLSSRERKLFLRPSRQFDYESEVVKKWPAAKKLIRAKKEGEIDFARRVFVTLARKFQYDYSGHYQDRIASRVCKDRKSDCGGLSILFSAILRSQGIPARALAGRWAQSAKPGATLSNVAYFQQHVKAEFYAQGVGWVPVDVSSAILHDKSAEKTRFFGNDPGDFITLHLDGDLSYDTLVFGVQTAKFFQLASYWATGNGDFEDVVIDEAWKVRKLK